jgi:tubulin polyglutamylase TTLL9
MKYKYFIYVKNDYGNIVRESLDRRENWENSLYEEIESKDLWKYINSTVEDSNWNLFWKSIEEINLNSGKLENIYNLNYPKKEKLQIVNHNPVSNFLGEKTIFFKKLMKYYQETNSNVTDIVPESYVFTEDISEKKIKNFLDKRSGNKKVLWIVKPKNLYGGIGIKIFDNNTKVANFIKSKNIINVHTISKLKKFSNPNSYLVQKYISNPLLLEGRKFDIRVNVLLTNDFNIYFSPYYLVRTSSYKYNTKLNYDESDEIVHLTNNTFQKLSSSYEMYEDDNVIYSSQFQKYLDLSYGKDTINVKRDFFPVWKEIIIDSILSIKNDILKKSNKNRYFYEILGFDIMIDENFKTWLIEVNQNPGIDAPTEMNMKMLPYLVEEITKLGVDPYFPSGNITPLPNVDFKTYFTSPDLKWEKDTTVKKLPHWFIPSVRKIPKSNYDLFELIYSETVPIENIDHQIYNKNYFLIDQSNINRFMRVRDDSFYYPFGVPKRTRSKSSKETRNKSK